jgi:hypothetical protein
MGNDWAGIIREATLVHRDEFDSSSRAAERLISMAEDIDRTLKDDATDQAESAMVAELEARWQTMTAVLWRDAGLLDDLLTSVNERLEPAGLQTHLLGGLSRSRDERLHTRAIGYVLRGHEHSRLLQEELVSRLLAQIVHAASARGMQLGQTVLGLRPIQVAIEPSYDVPGRKLRRCYPDLRILLGGSVDVQHTIIIENKVDSVDRQAEPDREGQLDEYARSVDAASRGGSEHVWLVYLTPGGDIPSSATNSGPRWIQLSYLDVAAAWRPVVVRESLVDECSAFCEFLRLYLGTVVQEICGLRLKGCAAASPARRARLARYLLGKTGDA